MTDSGHRTIDQHVQMCAAGTFWAFSSKTMMEKAEWRNILTHTLLDYLWSYLLKCLSEVQNLIARTAIFNFPCSIVGLSSSIIIYLKPLAFPTKGCLAIQKKPFQSQRILWRYSEWCHMLYVMSFVSQDLVRIFILAFSRRNWKFHHQSTSFKDCITKFDIKKIVSLFLLYNDDYGRGKTRQRLGGKGAKKVEESETKLNPQSSTNDTRNKKMLQPTHQWSF